MEMKICLTFMVLSFVFGFMFKALYPEDEVKGKRAGAKDKKSNKPEPSRACSWCGILCMASLVCFLVSAICVVWSL